ncbi:hypothetical protein BC361_10255 [Ensifer sp. LC54]|nr:hypothetical protein BC361_10255 [Ensifer sp. LC54]OCP28312.1 hypothetical protein BC363_00110 [Ensifer sp. LC384]
MRFWRQIDLFGLGSLDAGWFVSLCQRMSALCERNLDEFMRDNDARESFRFHAIDWQGKNVPVRRQEFDWVPKNYLENEVDFPFYQFHVSRALGRVVGFFDENQVFNILVFDPNHNIQPSRHNDYKIRPTRFGHCQYSSLISIAEEYTGSCTNPGCSVKDGLKKKLEEEVFDQTRGIILCKISDDHHDRFRSLRSKGHASDISEIFELGLVVYEDCAK